MDLQGHREVSLQAHTWQAPENSQALASATQAQNQSDIEGSFSPLRASHLPLNLSSASKAKRYKDCSDSKDLTTSQTAAGSSEAQNNVSTVQSSAPKGKRKKKIPAKIKTTTSKHSLQLKENPNRVENVTEPSSGGVKQTMQMAPMPAVPGKAEDRSRPRKAAPVIMERLVVQRTHWTNGIHNVFDHYPDSDDDNQYETTTHEVVGCGVLVRSKQTQKVDVMRPEALQQPDEKEPAAKLEEDNSRVLSVAYKEGLYWVYQGQSLGRDDRRTKREAAWISIRTMPEYASIPDCDPHSEQLEIKPNFCHLSKGQMIKFGRCRFKVVELSVEYQDDFELDKYSVINHPEEVIKKRARSHSFEAYAAFLQASHEGSVSEFDARSPLAVIREESSPSGDGPPVCKICLSEDEPGNPILSPCKCTGSMRYVHLSCIRQWLESKKKAH